MKVEVVYESGQTYNEFIESGTALISQIVWCSYWRGQAERD